MGTEDKKPTLEEATQEIWDTFEAGGNFAHNMISISLRIMVDNHGKEAADALYEELVAEGF